MPQSQTALFVNAVMPSGFSHIFWDGLPRPSHSKSCSTSVEILTPLECNSSVLPWDSQRSALYSWEGGGARSQRGAAATRVGGWEARTLERRLFAMTLLLWGSAGKQGHSPFHVLISPLLQWGLLLGLYLWKIKAIVWYFLKIDLKISFFFYMLELNDREENENHFPVIYGIGK